MHTSLSKQQRVRTCRPWTAARSMRDVDSLMNYLRSRDHAARSSGSVKYQLRLYASGTIRLGSYRTKSRRETVGGGDARALRWRRGWMCPRSALLLSASRRRFLVLLVDHVLLLAEADAVLQSLGLKAHLHQNLILTATRRREQPFLWEHTTGEQTGGGRSAHVSTASRVAYRCSIGALRASRAALRVGRACVSSTDDRS